MDLLTGVSGIMGLMKVCPFFVLPYVFVNLLIFCELTLQLQQYRCRIIRVNGNMVFRHSI